MSAIGLAVIGCGGMGGAHLNGLIELRRRGVNLIDLVAVCDIEEHKVKSFADRAERELGSKPSVYVNFNEMLSRESGLDAVDIATDHRSHHITAVPCLEAGKRAIVEKPLGVTMRACRRIVETAEKKGLFLATAENYRRTPANRAIHWAIEQGKIGTPRLVYWLNIGYWLGSWGWRHDKFTAGGGWTLDMGAHTADLLLYNVEGL